MVLKCFYKFLISKIFEKSINVVESGDVNGYFEGSSSGEYFLFFVVDIDCYVVNMVELCV